MNALYLQVQNRVCQHTTHIVAELVGNIGLQASTTTLRALATGHASNANMQDIIRVMLKEVRQIYCASVPRTSIHNVYPHFPRPVSFCPSHRLCIMHRPDRHRASVERQCRLRRSDRVEHIYKLVARGNNREYGSSIVQDIGNRSSTDCRSV